MPIHYLFKGRIAHIVAGSLTIYSVVQTSPGIILQTVQPYHYYSTCHVTDRDHDLRTKLLLCPIHGSITIYFAFELFVLLIKTPERLPRGNCVHLSPREQSDDASAQICGEWAIYDETVTPNSSKSTTPQEKRHAFTAFI